MASKCIIFEKIGEEIKKINVLHKQNRGEKNEF